MTTSSPRQQVAQAQTFSILNHLDKLQPAKGGSYICPNCQGHNLTINNQTGAYQCWNGCECRNIRDKIAPLPNRSDTTSYQNPRRQKTKKSKPPTPPEGEIHLTRLLAPADDIPQPQRDRDKEHGEVLKTTYVYSLTAEGQLNRWVIRTDWNDTTKPQGRDKTFRQWHRSESGEAICKKGDKPWEPYRIDEFLQALKATTGYPAGLVLEGEKCTEAARICGLAGTTLQGSSWGKDDLQRLAERVQSECSKAILVFLRDNDPTGCKKAKVFEEACDRVGVFGIVIDPLAIYPDLDDKGDIVQILEAMETPEVIRRLEEEIHRAIQARRDSVPKPDDTLSSSEKAGTDGQRAAWKPPMSNGGELGYWKEKKTGKGEDFEVETEWSPLTNFDFVVERELEDANGGGLVLQVKRSFEERQYRVILDSVSYTNPDKFADSLKAAMGVGVVCNLQKHELGALIHCRLHEYRTNRQGQLYRRIDRYGQQSDGVWVFRDRQYTPDGKPTSENETGWVFNPDLGKDDFIPSPELAPEDPQALKHLVDAARQFYGDENFHQVLLTMGWVVAGLHSQTIFKQENSFPLLNSHGEPGSCKTLAAETALSLIGMNWPEMGMLARVSVSALYEHGSRTGSLPFIWDDPERKPEHEELTKTWFNWKPRVVRANKQEPHSPMGVTSNHIFGSDQLATLTRFIRNPFKRFSGGNKNAFQELKSAQRLASGAFPMLIQLSYPRDEIAALEKELLTYLPLAHARIAQSLAIVTYYAEKIIELTAGSENILQWVIKNLCYAENDAENSGDSLQDFISKILSLESQNLIGDWNKQKIITQDKREWIAIYAENAWAVVDRQFSPATYNKKSLKSLVQAVGGRVDSSQRFAVSRDEVLAYYAARIRNEVPNEPRKVTHKAWLLPISLFGSGDTSHSSDGDSGSDPPPRPSPNSSTDKWSVDDKVPVTTFTAVTGQLPKTVTSQNADGCDVSGIFTRPCYRVTEKIDQKETEQNQTTVETDNSIRTNLVSNSGNSGNTVTAEAETQVASHLQPVTVSVTKIGDNSVTGRNMAVISIGDSVKNSLGNVAQITKTAPGGWLTSNGNHVSRLDLESASYSKVAQEYIKTPEQADLSEAQAKAAMLIDFAPDIFKNPQMLDELVEDWSEELKLEVWKFIPLELQQKYRALKQKRRAP